jgi:hypothetical protein
MAKSRQREASVEGAVVQYALKRKVLTCKFTSPGNKGVPDRMFIFEGRTMFLEFKRLGERPTKLQGHWLSKLGGHGAMASWVDNVPDGKRMVDSLVAGRDETLL